MFKLRTCQYTALLLVLRLDSGLVFSLPYYIMIFGHVLCTAIVLVIVHWQCITLVFETHAKFFCLGVVHNCCVLLGIHVHPWCLPDKMSLYQTASTQLISYVVVQQNLRTDNMMCQCTFRFKISYVKFNQILHSTIKTSISLTWQFKINLTTFFIQCLCKAKVQHRYIGIKGHK